MLVEPHHPVIVKEPAAPSLPLDIGGGSGSANDVNLVEFQKWSKVEIEMALKVSRKVVVVCVWGGGSV